MQANFNDFIGTFTNVFEEGYCEFLISSFEELKNNKVGTDRKKSENVDGHIKQDYSMSLNSEFFGLFNGVQADHLMFDGLQRCFDAYTDKYSILDNNRLNGKYLKLQKSDPGEGYHVWHCEQGNGEQSARGLVWIAYLNTLGTDNAGETEFLYQQRRIRPVKNTVVFFPAAFTHTHRGNPVHGNISKYIATGWFYLNH